MVILPLDLKGGISSLNVSKPTADEWTNAECTHIKLTSEHQLWDPYNPGFKSQENAMMDYHGDIRMSHSGGRSLVIHSVSTATDAADFTDDNNLHEVLRSNVSVVAADSLTGS
jgi:hypothetical protein